MDTIRFVIRSAVIVITPFSTHAVMVNETRAITRTMYFLKCRQPVDTSRPEDVGNRVQGSFHHPFCHVHLVRNGDRFSAAGLLALKELSIERRWTQPAGVGGSPPDNHSGCVLAPRIRPSPEHLSGQHRLYRVNLPPRV